MQNFPSIIHIHQHSENTEGLKGVMTQSMDVDLLRKININKYSQDSRAKKEAD